MADKARTLASGGSDFPMNRQNPGNDATIRRAENIASKALQRKTKVIHAITKGALTKKAINPSPGVFLLANEPPTVLLGREYQQTNLCKTQCTPR